MYYADEIRPTDDARPEKGRKVDKRELELALSLIDRFTGEFEAARYAHTYRERMLEVIESKGRGETIETPPTEERVEAPDLLAALRESVGRTKGGDGRHPRDRDGSELDELTVGELSKRASKLGIEGRSKMSKREIVSAIEKLESAA